MRRGGGGRGELVVGGVEVSGAKLLHCVTIGVGWGEGKGREEFARTHTLWRRKAT